MSNDRHVMSSGGIGSGKTYAELLILKEELKRHREAVEAYKIRLIVIKHGIDPTTNEPIDPNELAEEALERGEAILEDRKP